MPKIRVTMMVSVQIRTEMDVSTDPLYDVDTFIHHALDDKLLVLQDLCSRINARIAIDGMVVEQHQPGCGEHCHDRHELPQTTMPGLAHPERN